MTHASSIPDDSARTIGRVSLSACQHASAFQASACQHFSFSYQRATLPVNTDSHVGGRLKRGWWNASSTARTREAELLRRRQRRRADKRSPKGRSVLTCRAPRRRRNRTRRTSGRRLRSGYPGAHEVTRLVLLPSGPDTVHGAPLPGTRPSTPAAPVSTEPGSRLGRGSRPC